MLFVLLQGQKCLFLRLNNFKTQIKHFIIMFYRFLFICNFLISMSLGVNAQSELTMKNNMMYADVVLSHNGKTHKISSMIDTGCSYCLIDSTYAVDSCNIVMTGDYGSGVTASGQRINSFYVDIDSVCFGGIVFPKIHCFVADLAGKFKHYAPKFLIGADVLKRELWKFDLKQNKMTLCKNPVKNVKYTIKWKDNYYGRKFINNIWFDCKVDGKKTRVHFDSGSRRNWLPIEMGISQTTTIVSERADLANSLRLDTIGVAEKTPVSFSDYHVNLDFSLEATCLPRINTEFLWGKSFVLDYRKSRLYILE